jgi:PPK2 family polyphosphate:nucleotide phosphotransferase
MSGRARPGDAAIAVTVSRGYHRAGMADQQRLAQRLLVKPGTKPNLREFSADETHGYAKATAGDKVQADLQRLASLQERIWASKHPAVLIVLQGIDTAGKDGTIRHVMNAFNPQGCVVTGFGVPTPPEAAHDHLWRVHLAAPAQGVVGIFNRSHYESVLVVRVHNLVPKERWQGYYDEINHFEQLLADNGTAILKFFLHIDREEQRRRLQDRYADPTKQWKFQVGDLAERKLWDDYMAAYEDALSRCSTERAPWYAVPANHKWFRNLAIGEIVADRLEALHPAYPKVELPPDLRIT